MKIEHSDKLQALNASQLSNTRPKKPDGADFAEVLKEVSKSTPPEKMMSSQQGLSTQTIINGMGSEQKIGSEESASRLIDSLEKYQFVLADPKASLRQVGTVVDQMRSRANKVQPLVDGLPEDHQVKGVIKDALMHINMEIARFDRGDYVDE